MAVKLSEEARKQALASLRRFCAENLEVEPSDIEVRGLLDFVVEEIGPTIYNSGVADSNFGSDACGLVAVFADDHNLKFVSKLRFDTIKFQHNGETRTEVGRIRRPS